MDEGRVYNLIEINEGRICNLTINKIVFDYFGKTGHASFSFDPKLTILDGTGNDVIKAIGVVTDNKSIVGNLTSHDLSRNSIITSEIETSDGLFRVKATWHGMKEGFSYDIFRGDSSEPLNPDDFFEGIHQCEEEENLMVFRLNDRERYSERFLHYKEPEKYYSADNFRKMTGWAGITRCFRNCLSEFIRENRSTEIFSGEYIMEILGNGKIAVSESNDSNGPAKIRGWKGDFFEYLCYIDVIRFWETFNIIWDLNHEKAPIIVDLTGAGKGFPTDILIDKTKELERQIILLNSCSC